MAIFSYQWAPDSTSKKVTISLFKNGSPFTQQEYPQENGLQDTAINAYCDALVAQLEKDNAEAAVVAAQTSQDQSDFDDAYSALDAAKPDSPVDSDSSTVTNVILESAKAKILSAALSNSLNPYSLINTYQALYDSASIDVDLSLIDFGAGYGGVFRLQLWVDADGDGVHDGGETGSLDANVYIRLQKVGGVAQNYSPNSRGVVLVGGLEAAEYIYTIHGQSGTLITNGDAAGAYTFAEDEQHNFGERGIYAHNVPGPLCGGVSGAFFTDDNNNGTQDGGEAAGFSINAYAVMLSGPLGKFAIRPDNVGAYATAMDALPSDPTWALTVILPTGYVATGVSLPYMAVVTDAAMSNVPAIGIY